MSFFSSLLASAGAPTAAGSGPLPTLREDTYKAISATESWLSSPGAAGDGFSYRQVFTIIQPHFPDLKAPLPHEEVQNLVGWITDMTFEVGKVDGMAGTMVVQSWVDALQKSYKAVERWGGPGEADKVGAAMVYGTSSIADPARVTRDLTTRVQTLNSLKKVAAFVYGDGSPDARQADAYWSSKMM